MSFTTNMQWEFKNEVEMYAQLVGNFYGPNPELQKQKVSDSRKDLALKIAQFLNLKKTNKVLEIGSGTGDMALTISSQVDHVYCADISNSFLLKAQENCKSQNNISFHHIKNFSLDFLEGNTGKFQDRCRVLVS